jgi:hypothetical protein
MKAFLRRIAHAMGQEKDEIWDKKNILQPIEESLNEFNIKKTRFHAGFCFL